MSAVPELVAARLQQLAASHGSLQTPNFCVADLDFHSLRPTTGQVMEGMWSLEGDEFVFSLVGQLSANHTFLGEYGDLITLHCEDDASTTYGRLTRAKWKLALVVSSALTESPSTETLRRQMTHLKSLQERACELCPLKKGTTLGLSLVHSSRVGVRTTVCSENIYSPDGIAAEGDVPATEWPDSQGVFKGLIDDRKDKLVVRPLELYASDGSRVDMRSASDVFRPGCWVEVVCALKMWDTSESAGSGRSSGSRRLPVRSFQICTGSAQMLAVDRLDEGALTTRPRPRSLKRAFEAVAPVEAGPGPKNARASDTAVRRDVEMSV